MRQQVAGLPKALVCTVMGVHSEKCVVRRFHCCVNVIECTYTNQDSVAYYKPRPYDVI